MDMFDKIKAKLEGRLDETEDAPPPLNYGNTNYAPSNYGYEEKEVIEEETNYGNYGPSNYGYGQYGVVEGRTEDSNYGYGVYGNYGSYGNYGPSNYGQVRRRRRRRRRTTAQGE